MVEQTQMEKTSADDKSIGFDYQYYQFLYRLLTLKKGENIGLEVKDDIHTELENDCQILIQVKHTVQKNSDGKPIPLSTYSVDLWKTLSNWSKIICDENDNRTEIDAQLAFVAKTDFILTTNKSDNEKNTFIESIKTFKKNKNENVVLDALNNISNTTKDTEIKKYITNILSLNSAVLKGFFFNIHFDFDTEEIIKKCKDAIYDLAIPSEKIDETFSYLDSTMRAENYFKIKNGEKLIITYENARRLLIEYVCTRIRSPKIRETYIERELPAKLIDQTFIKQLTDINYIEPDDMNEVVSFTQKKMHAENNLDRWITEGSISQAEILVFEKNTLTTLENCKRKHFRGLSDSEIDKATHRVIDESLEKDMSLDSINLSKIFSNGEYFRLTNIPKTGWHKNWEKYKK